MKIPLPSAFMYIMASYIASYFCVLFMALYICRVSHSNNDYGFVVYRVANQGFVAIMMLPRIVH